MKTKRMGCGLVSVLFGCVHLAAFAAAGTATWRGGDGDWSDAARWGGETGAQMDTRVVDDGSTVTVSGGTASAELLKVDGGSTVRIQDGTFHAAGNNRFPNGGLFLGSQAGSAGTFRVDGGTVTLYANPHIGQYGTGTFVQTGGEVSSYGYFSIGRYAGSSGSAVFEGCVFRKAGFTSNGIYYPPRCLLVGEDGTGTLVVRSGATVALPSDTAAVSAALPGGLYVAFTEAATGTVRLERGGTLAVPRIRLRCASGTVVFDGGVLQVADGMKNVDGFAAGAGRLEVADGGAVVDVPDAGMTASIPLALSPADGSTGGFVKLGAGTLVLSGANAWTGPTIVSNGTLSVQSAAALPGYATPGRVVVEPGAHLALGADWTAEESAALRASLADPSVVTLQVDTSEGDRTISDDLDEPSGLVKTGANTLTLTGRNAFGGDVAVRGGVLRADFGQGLDARRAVVLAGGTLAGVSGTVDAPLGDGPGQVCFAAGTDAGFSAKGAPLVVDLGGAAETLVYGSEFFNPSALVLNGEEADADLTFRNGLDFTDRSLTVGVFKNTAVLTGPLTGDTFIKTCGGELVLGDAADNLVSTLEVWTGRLRTARNLFVTSHVGVLAGGTLRLDGKTISAHDFWVNPAAALELAPDAGIHASGIFTVKGGTFRQEGGTVTVTSGEPSVGGHEPFESYCSATYEMLGGRLDVVGNLQVGRYGTGTFLQKGGDVTVSYWPCAGRWQTGNGLIRHTGGTFRQTGAGNGYVVGEAGIGRIEVAGTADVDVAGSYGLYYLPNAAGKSGALHLDGGTLGVKKLTCTAYGTNRLFRFNGGTLKTKAATPAFISGALTEFSVTPIGGAVDTCGNDVTFNQPLTPAASQADGLLHRWSFNDGDLSDSVGGATAVADGTVQFDATGFTVAGGARGTGAVNLGAGLVPDNEAGFTIELWATQRAIQRWSRVFDVGSNGTDYCLVSWTMSSDLSRAAMGIGYGGERLDTNAFGGFPLDQEFHIAVTLSPNGDGGWTMKGYKQDAKTGATLATSTVTPNAGWSPANQNDSIFWLGRSLNANDLDSSASYNEVRIWNRPLSEAELSARAAAGPDECLAGSFAKRGAGTLTLTGANTFGTPVAVEQGSLALAAGATLASDVTVATGATLALGAGARAAGTVALEVAAGGVCGRVASDGAALDLSSLDLALVGLETLETTRTYVLARSDAGFTGTPRVAGIPSNWRVSVDAARGELRLARAGMVFVVR